MENGVIEAHYPITFRKDDAFSLGQLLKSRQSAVLIGMKRVGISNFLRFFLNHKDVVKTYIPDGNIHFFIPVDLNDLVEREMFPFWMLTLKRISDSVGKSSLDVSTKKYIESLFLDSMQSKDTFLTIESIRKSLIRISEVGFMPTIFFIRFDRLKDIVTLDLFNNLQGLKDSTNQKLSYVFTSARGLTALSPEAFPKSSLSAFAHNLYIRPAKRTDIQTIFDTYNNRYKLSLTDSLIKSLFEIVDGYVQYLQLAFIVLSEKNLVFRNKNDLFNLLSSDERIILQSEELWESLTQDEQKVLQKAVKKQQITEQEKKQSFYLWDTGFLVEENQVFSPLLTYYLNQRQEKKENHNVEFSKKENLLFTFLKSKEREVCERDAIIQAVWPEVEAFGITDWAIDRLVARVRSKLKLQKSQFEIQTIKTRGYKMVEI